MELDLESSLWFPGPCSPKHQATEFQDSTPGSGFADTVDNLPCHLWVWAVFTVFWAELSRWRHKGAGEVCTNWKCSLIVAGAMEIFWGCYWWGWATSPSLRSEYLKWLAPNLILWKVSPPSPRQMYGTLWGVCQVKWVIEKYWYLNCQCGVFYVGSRSKKLTMNFPTNFPLLLSMWVSFNHLFYFMLGNKKILSFGHLCNSSSTLQRRKQRFWTEVFTLTVQAYSKKNKHKVISGNSNSFQFLRHLLSSHKWSPGS